MMVYAREPGRGRARSERGARRARARGPVPRGARAVHDRHRALRRRGAPGDDSLEHADLYRSYGQYCVQRARAGRAAARRGEAELGGLPPARRRAMGFEEPVFRMTADALIDALLARLAPAWRDGYRRAARRRRGGDARGHPPGRAGAPAPADRAQERRARGAAPAPPPDARGAAGRRSGSSPRPRIHTLNSTFMERPELRERSGGMSLRLSPSEAAARASPTARASSPGTSSARRRSPCG